MPNAPLKTFIIYARDDKAHKDDLLRHLKPLVAAKMLHIWHDGDINPGEEWEKAIKKNLKASEIILVLVTVNCLNSEFIQTDELEAALLQMQEGESKIIPIIVSPCGWKFQPIFRNLQGLPEDMKPITKWENRDEAWTNVIEGIAAMAEHIHVEKSQIEKNKAEAAEVERLAKIAEEERLQNEKIAAAEKAERERLAKIEEESMERERLLKIEADKQEKERLAKIQAEEKSNMAFSSQQKQNYTPYYIGGAVLSLLLVLGVWQPWNDTSKNLTGLKDPSGLDAAKIETPITKSKDPFEGQFVKIPAGSFMMGDKESDYAQPVHKVNIGSFYMLKTEVTQAQWKAVMGSNPSNFSNCDDCPVENVSWDDIQVFLKKLNTLTGKNYRLPSEAEWEYAARGGQDFKYAGSNNIDEVAWYGENAGGTPHPVGNKKANRYGLYDMTGNVWEWCEDTWHDSYKGAPTDGSAWVDNKSLNHVLRGGSWYEVASSARLSTRPDSPPLRNTDMGFRFRLA